MLSVLAYLFGLIVVAGVLFLLAAFTFGRGEETAPPPPGGTPVELPDGRPAAGRDLRRLRLSVVFRGYRMDEVDWVLDQLAGQIDERDRELARLSTAAGGGDAGTGDPARAESGADGSGADGSGADGSGADGPRPGADNADLDVTASWPAASGSTAARPGDRGHG